MDQKTATKPSDPVLITGLMILFIGSSTVVADKIDEDGWPSPTTPPFVSNTTDALNRSNNRQIDVMCTAAGSEQWTATQDSSGRRILRGCRLYQHGLPLATFIL